MTPLSRWTLLLAAMLVAAPAAAQRRPGNPPAKPARPPEAEPGDREISPSVPPAGAATENRTTPDCETVRRKARYNVYFDKVEIEKLIQTVSDATCKTFILPETIRGKISIIGPENGKVEVSGDQFYAAFLAALDANNFAVYPYGRFLKIIDKQRAKQFPIPTVTDSDEPYTTNEQMVTRLFKVKYVEVEQLRGVLQQLVTPSGDTIPFQPDTIIVNDLGSNMHRLQRLVEQLDTRASSDEVRVIQVQYASAQEIADKVTKLFETRNPRPGQRPGGAINAPPPAVAQQGAPPAANGAASEGAGGAATLSQLIPDERTNKLIVVASPAAFDRISALIREIDVPISGEGRINVYNLENANAEDMASTLQSLAQGTANRPKAPTGAPPSTAPGARGAPVAAELFAGEVKISADKATNSLVIVASQNDFRNLSRVIERLDIPRRQVFVEAVIMEVNLGRNSELGINLHGGVPLTTSSGTLPAVFGTSYAKGFPPSFSLLSLANLGGFLAGLQGPMTTGLKEVLGFEVPQFGLVLHAMQQSNDVNVLSTPHLLTSDNEEAEITVGQNVPFQAGFSPSNLGSTLGGLAGAAGATGTNALAAGLGGLGGLGSMFAPITRQNVELKLTVKPQINESEYIRMVISEQTEEIASDNQTLGPTTSKRSAKTTVVAKDQQTIVLGGIMQDRTIESVSKVPILGDIPLLGHLFREQSRKKVKTNLLLFLTPYIIRDQGDFRRIFERKMKERQQFVEQFYGQVPGYDVAIDFSRKPGPIAHMVGALHKESSRLENGGPGTGSERLIRPAVPPSSTPAPATSSHPPSTMPAPAAPGPVLPGPVPPPGNVSEEAQPLSSPEPSGTQSAPEPPPEEQQLRVQPPPEGEIN